MTQVPEVLVKAVEAMGEEERRAFIRHTNTHTPKSKVQLELKRLGLTVNELRRWLNTTYPCTY